MAQYVNGTYTTKSGKTYNEEEQKKLAQQYALAALGNKNGYLSPAQTENALANAYPNPITPIGDNSGNKGGNDAANAISAAYSAYAAAIEEQTRLLREQQELAERQRRAAMESTINANNKAADKSLREAYVANMLSKKNLPQQLKALGVSGGASETTLADLNNTYMNNRFGIEENRNTANSQAMQAYNNGVAGDYSEFLAKQYALQGNLAEKAFDASVSAAKNKDSSTNLNGYKIGDDDTVYTSGQALLRELRARGYTEAQAREYLKYYGI